MQISQGLMSSDLKASFKKKSIILFTCTDKLKGFKQIDICFSLQTNTSMLHINFICLFL